MPDALARAIVHGRAWLDSLGERRVGARASRGDLLAAFDVGFPEGPTPPAQVVDELAAAAEPGLCANASGRYFAWVNGGALDGALAADVLAAMWDQNGSMQAVSPAIAALEEVTGAWLKELFDLPRDASFAFVTGCQGAHLTSLAAARHGVLARAGWNVARQGLFGAPRARIFSSAHVHGSVDRAARLLGFGSDGLVKLEAGADSRLAPDTLRAALAEHAGPAIVVLNAADLNVGAFDPFKQLIPVAREHGAWVHVDGAFGLFARASRSKRPLTEGLEDADSWATDAHKWLNTPYDCGIAMVRDADAHRAAMSHRAAYLVEAVEGRDQMDWNPEWSRRGRVVAVYAALRELGRSGVEALVDRCCARCRDLVLGMGALDGAEALNEPQLNMGVVRFRHPDAGASPEAQDAFNDRVIAAINASGEAFFSPTTWQGARAMRVSVVNWRTSEADVARVIAAADRAVAAARDAVLA